MSKEIRKCALVVHLEHAKNPDDIVIETITHQREPDLYDIIAACSVPFFKPDEQKMASGFPTYMTRHAYRKTICELFQTHLRASD